MGPDKRDGVVAPIRPGRIPVPPIATADASKGQAAPTKSGIPSPRRRTVSGLSRMKDVTASAVLTATSAAPGAKRPTATATSKIGKPLVRPSSAQACDDKDDTRQRDSGHKDAALKRDVIQRDKTAKDVAPRRPTSEAGSLPEAGKRLLKQPSLLLKSSVVSSSPAAPVTTSVVKTSTVAPSKPLPRSVSTCRDRQSNDTRTSMIRRSMSVGKGRTLATQPDSFPQQAGARFRPIIERPVSAAGAQGRHGLDRRDTSTGRIRPISAPNKTEPSQPSISKPALQTITEAPSRPAAAAAAAAAGPALKPAPSKPVFSLNLAALKQHNAATAAAATTPPPAAPPLPATEPSPCISPEGSGRPVPKLDLGGILQRRAEEQACEPVFVVAPSAEDTGQLSASGASQQGQQDKRKSGSRQTSAKEDPAEHFYLYPKVQPQEKKRIEDICRVVPKKQQAAITELFSKMVEARQNCEQMCFRGHRLLDQAQAEFRNRLAQKEEEMAQTKEEAAQWRQEAEYLRAQLALLLGARQADDSLASADTHKGQEEPNAVTEDEQAACLRSSLLSTFDNMARLGAGMGMGMEAIGGCVEE